MRQVVPKQKKDPPATCNKMRRHNDPNKHIASPAKDSTPPKMSLAESDDLQHNETPQRSTTSTLQVQRRILLHRRCLWMSRMQVVPKQKKDLRPHAKDFTEPTTSMATLNVTIAMYLSQRITYLV
uniref:Ovule protein n=1 Tax=Panagrellus redivivus TaxID=6233 RepID=A0A7E4UPF4_PANRE